MRERLSDDDGRAVVWEDFVGFRYAFCLSNYVSFCELHCVGGRLRVPIAIKTETRRSSELDFCLVLKVI